MHGFARPTSNREEFHKYKFVLSCSEGFIELLCRIDFSNITQIVPFLPPCHGGRIANCPSCIYLIQRNKIGKKISKTAQKVENHDRKVKGYEIARMK